MIYIFFRFLLILLSLMQVVYAQDANDSATQEQCSSQGQMLSPIAYLKALSLDLRGELPSEAEISLVESQGQVPSDLIDDMLNSDAFAQRFVRYHHSLLWPYLGNSDTTPGYRLAYDAPWDQNGGRTRLWYFARPALRGDSRPCRNEPESNPDDPVMISEGNGIQREGYVCVRRYADHPFGNQDQDCPQGEIKVCAQDALTHFQSRVTGDRCDVLQNRYSPPPIGCGCGPNLRWCGDYQQYLQPLLDGFDQQIRWVIDQDRPYFEMLSDAPPMLNGPLAHYYKYMAPFMRLSLNISASLVPDLDYRVADQWVEIDTGPEARGILTNWVYLARFVTQRARVDRFYQSFLCQPFQPPVSGINLNTADRDQPDLQIREGCRYCHSIIEPIAAYWGRYTEGASSYLDVGNYPDYDESCYRCAVSGICSQRCNQAYITQAPTGAEIPYLGYLKAYLFRRPEHQNHVNEGPKTLVMRALVDGRLASCTVKNAFKWLVGRSVLADEQNWLDQVTLSFMDQNYPFKSLVKSIVSSEIYRRVR